MNEPEKVIEKREKKILNWMKKYPNNIIVILLIFIVVLRLYYFFLTVNQPIWWDGADYMNMAKSWGFDTPYNKFDSIRPVLFSWIVSLFYRFTSFPELLARILILSLSFVSIISVYYLGKEMFEERIGLFACFLMSIFYLHLFLSYRILMDMPSTAFFTFSAVLFYKYFKSGSKRSLYYAAFFIGIGTMFKQSTVFLIPGMFLYVLLTEKLNFLKKKEVWISALIFLIAISPWLIWAYHQYGVFILTKTSETARPPGGFISIARYNTMMNYLVLFPTYIFSVPYTGTISFLWLISVVVLLIIFLFSIYKMIIGFDLLIKKPDNELKRQLYLFLIFSIPIIFTSSMITHNEDRYIINCFPAFFIMISLSVFKVYDYFNSKKIKILGILFLIFAILFFIYVQLTQADSLIKIKATSYLEIKQAGLWFKQYGEKDDIMMTKSMSQVNYYSNKKTIFIPDTKEELESSIKSDQNIKYYMLSVYERLPDWAFSYPQENNFTIAQVFFRDKQPMAIIYKIR